LEKNQLLRHLYAIWGIHVAKLHHPG